MAFRAAPPGRAALDLVEPTQLASPVAACLCPLGHSQARLHTHAHPLVPEGPHGDAVLPHKAPHGAAAALHAWLGGSGQPRAHGTALRPWSALAGGLALRSLPSSWWEEERKGPKPGGLEEALAPQATAGPSRRPCCPRAAASDPPG